MRKNLVTIMLCCVTFGCSAESANVREACTEVGAKVKTASQPNDDLYAEALRVCVLAMKEAGDELPQDLTEVVLAITDKAQISVRGRTNINASLKSAISAFDDFVGMKQLEDWGLNIQSPEARIWWQQQLFIFTHSNSVSEQRLFDFSDQLWRVGVRVALDRVEKNEKLSFVDEAILQKASDVLIQLVESSYNTNSAYSPEEALIGTTSGW